MLTYGHRSVLQLEQNLTGHPFLAPGESVLNLELKVPSDKVKGNKM